MQTLLQDVRSAAEVAETVAGKEYKIVRYVAGAGGKLEKKAVIWKLVSDTKVTRQLGHRSGDATSAAPGTAASTPSALSAEARGRIRRPSLAQLLGCGELPSWVCG